MAPVPGRKIKNNSTDLKRSEPVERIEAALERSSHDAYGVICTFWAVNYTKIRLAAGLRPDPLRGGAIALPQTL